MTTQEIKRGQLVKTPKGDVGYVDSASSASGREFFTCYVRVGHHLEMWGNDELTVADNASRERP